MSNIAAEREAMFTDCALSLFFVCAAAVSPQINAALVKS